MPQKKTTVYLTVRSEDSGRSATGASRRRQRLAERSALREFAALTIQKYFRTRFDFHIVPSAVRIQRTWRVYAMERKYRPEGAVREWPPAWAGREVVSNAVKLQCTMCTQGLCVRPMMHAWRARLLIMSTHVCANLCAEYTSLRAQHRGTATLLGGGDLVSEELFEALHRATDAVLALNNIEESASKRKYHVTRNVAHDSLECVDRSTEMVRTWLKKTEAGEWAHEGGDWSVVGGELCKYMARSDAVACVEIWKCYLGALMEQAGQGRDLEVDTSELVAWLDGWLGCGNRGNGFGNPVVHLVICAFRFEGCTRAKEAVNKYRGALVATDWVCIVEKLLKYKCACIQCERQCVYDLLNAGGDIGAMYRGVTESESPLYNLKVFLCARTCGAWLLEETKKFSK